MENMKLKLQKGFEIAKEQVVKHRTALATGFVVGATSLNASAAATGNADLDTLIDSMTGGLANIVTGGLLIVGGVIGVGITFLGARWLWNMFRNWLSRAQ